MFIGIIFAILVAMFWSVGEINYSRLVRNVDRANVYFYQYFTRAIIYLSVVLIFNVSLFGTFNLDHFIVFLPIILCDLFASYVVNIAVSNGKLSVVSPIMAAYPVVDIFLGLLILHEKIGILPILLSSVIAISIIILTSRQKKTKSAPHPLKGVIFSIAYMLLVASSVYFEKNAYIGDFSVYELYFYKGIVYLLTSGLFMIFIGIAPVKLKRPNKDIIFGTGITPVGNVLNSFALNFSNIIIVTPISSLYSVITNILSRKLLKEKLSFVESLCISLILVCTIILIIYGIV